MVLVAFVVSVGLAVLGQAFLHQVPRFGSRTSSPPYSSQVDDKAVVMQYFNNEGFDRWSKIYSESGEVNKVQLDIRTGHQQIIDKVLGWIENEDNRKKTVCDVGCGVGSLSIPMASKFKLVYASDISAAMTFEAHSRAQFRGVRNMQVETKDMDNLTGSYDTVTCIDVMIHYPSDKISGIIWRLGQLANERLILSFAPRTLFYSLLKKLGALFPGKSRTTRAYLHSEEEVVRCLQRAGFRVQRSEMTATRFYFSRLLEAVRDQ